jgi:protein ImuB
MAKRFVSIWFRHLATDWFAIREVSLARHGQKGSDLKNVPFVLRAPSHGRMIIAAVNAMAESKGIDPGMVLADARALLPDLHVQDHKPALADKLLKRLAEWCIRFTPIAAADPPDGIFLDVTGCSHLWGGDEPYLAEIVRKLTTRGYDVRAAIADTPGVAWGVARFGMEPLVITGGKLIEALSPLPPQALRLEEETVVRLHKLGLHQVGKFLSLPRSALRRRFGQHLMVRLDMALGRIAEPIVPVVPVEPHHERLPCMEPIVTATGIAIALRQLLETLCLRLRHEQKGLRTAAFKCYRVDGKVEKVEVGTSRPTHHVDHLFKLFEIKLSTIEPALGIELFVLEAIVVEEHYAHQEKMWEGSGGLEDARLAELMDRLAVRIGMKAIHRYVADAHHWPERSFRRVISLEEQPMTPWRTDNLRPLYLLRIPERIDVTAPIPDYPPMLFRYKGVVHKIARADGPERIEQEWWLQQGQHRDYYCVEDEEGNRYWLFRLGSYDEENDKWYLHGVFG